jgi:mono/diheme cytochrome c family protein
MRRRPLRIAAATLLVVAGGAGLAACGSKGVSVPKASAERNGAELFAARCSGCHTIGAAGTQGSAVNPRQKLTINGPNFNQRRETPSQVLYAIRNGGFSGAIMPQNIVVGKQAQEVAAFVAKYSGKQAKNPPSPGG